MSDCHSCLVRTAAVLLAAAAVAAVSPAAQGQIVDPFLTRAVGGIAIDPNGVLDNAAVDALGELQKIRVKALTPIPAGMKRAAGTRHISLRRLEAAIQKYADAGKALPDEIKYLAGLQQIHYVFVYPKQHDIVLAGPGEGWKVDAKGNVVGVSTGRPVMLLDDLLVALRSARAAAETGISCSIDPTPEGLNQLKQHVAKLHTIGDPQTTAAGIEKALGRQQITVTGVPPGSHFARVLVAADYRMKRLAMNFEPAPVRGLPSFLHLMEATGHGMSSVLPRWWLTPEYQVLLRDADGLAWQLQGASVKAMTEDDFLTAAGERQHTGRGSPVAQKWADNMTREYDRLAVADPVFGELRNCADLALVAALVVKENLTEKAGYSMPILLDSSLVKTTPFFAPRQVDSSASLLKKGSNWVISASGGVRIDFRTMIRKTETSTRLAPVRDEALLGEHEDWWWN